MTLDSSTSRPRQQSADDSPSPPRENSNSFWKIPLALLVAGICSFWCLDHVVSYHFVKTGRLPGDLAKLFEAAEHFGTVWGQFMILWVVFVLDRSRAYRIPRIAAAAIVGGLAADLVKLAVSRVRPKYFEFSGNGIFESFVGWLRFGEGGADFQSFPSGHTASAVAFALALSWAYPRARTVFLVIAAFVAMQRIESTAHFMSDTMVGAAIGWWVGCWFVGNTSLSRWWTRREAEWRGSKDSAMTLSIVHHSAVDDLGHDTAFILNQETSRSIHEERPLCHVGVPSIGKAGASA